MVSKRYIKYAHFRIQWLKGVGSARVKFTTSNDSNRKILYNIALSLTTSFPYPYNIAF